MLGPLAALLLQLPALTPAPVPATAATRQDTTTASKDSTAAERRIQRRAQLPPKRDSVTAQHLTTAYRSLLAQDILTLARRARTAQDSSLRSYDATTYQRISAGIALTRFGRDRLAFRTESATRVQWQRGVGAYVDVTASRTVVPIAGRSLNVDMARNISPIPYYPGKETLMLGVRTTKADVDENQGMVHPLANGAEAYYTYEAGDSMTFRLPDGKSVQLRELRVRPRTPKWNLAVGSLWFDMRGGQLVRAAYRMAVPMDVGAVATAEDSSAFDDVPLLVKPMLFPMTAQISAIAVEYGLFQGQFWLPRLRVAEGGATAGPMRIPFKLEQRYDYSVVNAESSLPAIPLPPARPGAKEEIVITPDFAIDSLSAAHRRKHCDSTGTRSYTRGTRDSSNLVFVRIPCDSAKLANSPDLPPSIYESGEQVSGGEEMDALMKQALSLGAQAAFAPQLPQIGWETPRYNRIEGLSLGARADQQLGAGYSAHAMGRIGLADPQPVVELTAARSDLRRTIAITGYNRLASASDYGNPFGLGSSLSALFFARDEAYYYRASGVELTSTPDQTQGQMWSWGLFAEQERAAARRTTFAVARGATGFSFDTNLVADRGRYFGARTRLVSTFGLNPEGFRLLSDIKLEGARGDTGNYGRVALDLTLWRGIGNGAVALTLAGGTSVGELPTQRNWLVGGSQTVRGERAALEPGRMGNAFWLTRGEVAYGLDVVRPVAFVDVGWAGDRTKLHDVGRPVSGAGVGMSVMDGLIRFDVARGIFPEQKWRVYSYLEGRF